MLTKTESRLLKRGKGAYQNLTEKQMNIIQCLDAIPVQRNSGIDGFCREYVDGRPVSVKIQKDDESLGDAAEKLEKASRKKQCSFMVLVRTHMDGSDAFDFGCIPDNMRIIDSYEVEMDVLMDGLKNRQEYEESAAI